MKYIVFCECNHKVMEDELLLIIPQNTYSEEYHVYSGDYEVKVYKCKNCGEEIVC